MVISQSEFVRIFKEHLNMSYRDIKNIKHRVPITQLGTMGTIKGIFYNSEHIPKHMIKFLLSPMSVSWTNEYLNLTFPINSDKDALHYLNAVTNYMQDLHKIQPEYTAFGILIATENKHYMFLNNTLVTTTNKQIVNGLKTEYIRTLSFRTIVLEANNEEDEYEIQESS